MIKHLPDAPLMLDDDLHRRTLRCFADELEMWQADEAGHLMLIATFTAGRTGLASVQELSLAMTNEHWLPYESAADKLLLDTAIANHRRFTKCLRYNLAATQAMATLVLTDTNIPTAAYLLESAEERADIDALQEGTGADTWTWAVGESMPQLPTRRRTLAAEPSTRVTP